MARAPKVQLVCFSVAARRSEALHREVDSSKHWSRKRVLQREEMMPAARNVPLKLLRDSQEGDRLVQVRA